MCQSPPPARQHCPAAAQSHPGWPLAGSQQTPCDLCTHQPLCGIRKVCHKNQAVLQNLPKDPDPLLKTCVCVPIPVCTSAATFATHTHAHTQKQRTRVQHQICQVVAPPTLHGLDCHTASSSSAQGVAGPRHASMEQILAPANKTGSRWAEVVECCVPLTWRITPCGKVGPAQQRDTCQGGGQPVAHAGQGGKNKTPTVTH